MFADRGDGRARAVGVSRCEGDGEGPLDMWGRAREALEAPRRELARADWTPSELASGFGGPRLDRKSVV